MDILDKEATHQAIAEEIAEIKLEVKKNLKTAERRIKDMRKKLRQFYIPANTDLRALVFKKEGK